MHPHQSGFIVNSENEDILGVIALLYPLLLLLMTHHEKMQLKALP